MRVATVGPAVCSAATADSTRRPHGIVARLTQGSGMQPVAASAPRAVPGVLSRRTDPVPGPVGSHDPPRAPPGCSPPRPPSPGGGAVKPPTTAPRVGRAPPAPALPGSPPRPAHRTPGAPERGPARPAAPSVRGDPAAAGEPADGADDTRRLASMPRRRARSRRSQQSPRRIPRRPAPGRWSRRPGRRHGRLRRAVRPLLRRRLPLRAVPDGRPHPGRGRHPGDVRPRPAPDLARSATRAATSVRGSSRSPAT